MALTIGVPGIECRGLSGKLQAALYDFGVEDSFRLAVYLSMSTMASLSAMSAFG